MKRKNIKRVFLFCTVFLVLLNIFPLFSYASPNPSGSGGYITVCPAFASAELLPFGEDTIVIFYDTSFSDDMQYWYFLDKGSDLTYNAAVDNLYPDVASQSYPYTGFFIDDNPASGSTLSYWRLVIYSASEIIKVSLNTSTGSYITSRLGSTTPFDPSDPYSPRYYRYKYITNFRDKNSSLSYQLKCSHIYCYGGHDINYLIDSDSTGSWGSDSNYLSYSLAMYPDSVYRAVQTINGNQAVLTQYYLSLDRQIGELQSSLTRIENSVSDLNDNLTEGNSELQSQLSSAQSEIESNANAAASNAASEINNAGEDISDIDNDVSDVNGIVSKCSEWVSDLDRFADNIDEAESGVASALENGKTLVNGFFGAAPPIVIALLTFCLCWFVVRKVIGR